MLVGQSHSFILYEPHSTALYNILPHICTWLPLDLLYSIGLNNQSNWHIIISFKRADHKDNIKCKDNILKSIVVHTDITLPMSLFLLYMKLLETLNIGNIQCIFFYPKQHENVLRTSFGKFIPFCCAGLTFVSLFAAHGEWGGKMNKKLYKNSCHYLPCLSNSTCFKEELVNVEGSFCGCLHEEHPIFVRKFLPVLHETPQQKLVPNQNL